MNKPDQNIHPQVDLRLTIIGSNAAIPGHKRGLSAQVLQTASNGYLIDCGEGTQFGLLENKIRMNRIDHIFISHLHGDHIFGLFGLLSSASMQGRSKEMTIFAPKGLEMLFDAFTETQSLFLTFDLRFEAIDTKISRKIFEDDHFRVYSIPLHHRIPTTGFKFEEKPKSENIRKEIIEELHLTVDQIKLLKSGTTVCLENGTWLSPGEACYRKMVPRSFAYVSDTKYDPSIIKYIRGVDLLFHESTYMTEAEQLAVDRMHSTAIQAATIAQKAEVKKLVLGHFSSRYSDLLPMLEEARSVFPNSWLGLDGDSFEL